MTSHHSKEDRTVPESGDVKLTNSETQQHWRARVWDEASVSAAPPGVFYARIVHDGIPYTGAGATHDGALSDLENRIEEALDA